jgi:hypothetical protein
VSLPWPLPVRVCRGMALLADWFLRCRGSSDSIESRLRACSPFFVVTRHWFPGTQYVGVAGVEETRRCQHRLSGEAWVFRTGGQGSDRS